MGKKKLKDTASEFEKLEAIKKLNEELTAENARFLEETDILKEEVKSLQVDKNVLGKEAARLLMELQSIKAKMWYKLFTWRCK